MAQRALTTGVALIVMVPTLALAQAAPAGDPAAQPPPADTSASTTTPAGASPAGSAPAHPVIPATGFGWSTTPKKPGPRWRPRAARSGSQTSDAILPGFETLGDGSTRLFVQLSKPVKSSTWSTRASSATAWTLIYVLSGAHVDRRNNYNPLVTVHFNTPVTSARLVPHGQDLWFVVDLRANVTPQVTMDATKEGGAMLRIDFPHGDYLPGGATSPAAPSPPTPAPAPAASTAVPDPY